ncbi:hypothetical protein B0J18DRAFT_483772 [Chaetomium sp. MPI-SDFR-AT-0129]|nr:hypothetical protein B0J18DRAFT_483772 [Chaetomium sp. MPI-SDFR-AT-0129]
MDRNNISNEDPPAPNRNSDQTTHNGDHPTTTPSDSAACGNGTEDTSFHRPVPKRRYEDFCQEMENDFISTNIDDFEWSRPRFEATQETQKLREIASEEVFVEPPATMEARSGMVNWVARNYDCGESITYNIKGVADRRTVEALSGKILALCKRHGTPVFNIKIDLESAGVIEQNRLRRGKARSKPAPADTRTVIPAQTHHSSAPAADIGTGANTCFFSNSYLKACFRYTTYLDTYRIGTP